MYYISYRNEHWNISNYLPWGVPIAYFYFSELLVHKPGEGFFLGLLPALLSPLVISPLQLQFPDKLLCVKMIYLPICVRDGDFPNLLEVS